MAKSIPASIAYVALSLLALVELLMEFPVVWWLYLSLVPFLVIGLCGFPPSFTSKRRVGVLLATLSTMALLFFVPWTSRKPFLQDLDRIHPGMSVPEVRSIMGRYMENPKYPLESVAERSEDLSFRHSNDGRFNADIGVVIIKSGKVVEVTFLPD